MITLAFEKETIMDATLLKLLSIICRPLPIALLVMLAGLILAPFNRRWCLGFLLAGFTTISVFSLNITARHLISALEQPYTPVHTIPNDVNTIVVLAAGVRGSKNGPPNTQLSATTLSRLVEGVRLYQLSAQHKPTQLILSGGRIFTATKGSNVVNTANLLGVPTKKITITRGVINTAAEAKIIHSFVRNKPFLLVTSASHMQRALWLFKREGMSPIPAATQFMENRYSLVKGQSFIPQASNLVRCDIALHEYLGLLWEKAISHK